MNAGGYALFSYRLGSGQDATLMGTTVHCGRSELERALTDALYPYGLEIPDGNLIVDQQRAGLSILSSLALSADASILVYRRYPTQPGLGELLDMVDHMIEAPYDSSFEDRALCDQFEEFLVGNMAFAERARFRFLDASQVEIHGRVRFQSALARGPPREEQEYLVEADNASLRAVSEVLRNHRYRWSCENRVSSPEDPYSVQVDAFLRTLGIQPSRSSDRYDKVYSNLRRTAAALLRVATDDLQIPYSAASSARSRKRRTG